MFFFLFLSRGSEGTLNDCRVVFVDEIFKIEKPGARPLSFADGKFLSMRFSFRLTLNLLCNGDLVLFDQ